MTRLYVRCALLATLLVYAVSEETCPAVSDQCTCEFNADAEDGGEPVVADTTTKSEALAAAAGAMTPLLLTGAGFGIYKFIKSRGDDSLGMDRSNSRLSDEMDDSSPNRKPPPYYSGRGSRAVPLTDAGNNQSAQSGQKNSMAF